MMKLSRGVRSAALVAGCASAVSLVGCGGSHESSTLSAADFARADAQPVVAQPAPARPVEPASVIGPMAASDGIMDVTGTPGPPSSPAPGAEPKADPVRQGDAVLVDAKVGDINGKPVYANAFLAPLADRLRAEAKTMNSRDWREAARQRIGEALAKLVQDELIRAEALANMPPEQKAGFFAFVSQLQQGKLAENQGSREATDRALLESSGKSLDEYMRQAEVEQLVGYELNQKIDRRVHVSKRDIDIAYQKQYDKYNPKPRAVFRLVMIPKDEAEQIAAFQRDLAAGTSFEKLATQPANSYKRDTGGLEERMLTGDRASSKFFSNEALNQAARTLEPGHASDQIDLGTSKAWLYFEGVVSQKKSLYDAQLELESDLRIQRQKEAREKYFRRLQSRANMTSLEEMAARLNKIAQERFYPLQARDKGENEKD